jgi:DNA-binding NtrC family response regulator
LPPLRKRPGDLPLLVDHFIRKYRGQSRIAIRGISRRAQTYLEAQPWTGNVRELENAIQTAVVLNRTGSLDVEDFPFLLQRLGSKGEGLTGDVLDRLRDEARRAARLLLAAERTTGENGVYHSCVDAVEKSVVDTALEHCGGNQVRASKTLGISRNTLRSKMAIADQTKGDGEA